MKRTRVLVVDDSAAIRRLLIEAMSGDPDLEVVGTADNGDDALKQIAALRPDVVTLDVEMPGKNGLEVLRATRRTHPDLPIIMFSALTERGSQITIQALTEGASDYISKTAAGDGIGTVVQRVRHDLLPRVKALAERRRAATLRAVATVGLPRDGAPAPRPARNAEAGQGGHVSVIAIGVSTGGPAALSEVLPKLPASLPVPVLLVQHMPATFTRLLAQRLASQCAVRVEEARHGQLVEPGMILIAPGDQHMVLSRETGAVRVVLNREAQEHGCRPAIDPLFRSVAEVYRSGALALVLTGMGTDGLLGSQQIRARGGRVWVQDEATSVVWAMPGAIAKVGGADRILPLREFPGAIARASQTPGLAMVAEQAR